MHARQVFDDPGYYLARCTPNDGGEWEDERMEFRDCVIGALRKCHAPQEMIEAARDMTGDISRRNDIHSLLASCSYGSMCARIEALEQSELTFTEEGEQRVMKLEQRLTRIEGYLEAEMPRYAFEGGEDHDEQDRMAFESEKIEQQGLEQ